MQNCSECGIELTEDTAYKKTDKKWQSKCRNCFNRYCSDRWTKRKFEMIELMGSGCNNCGYDKYHGALELHHLNPKDKDVSWNKLKLRSWDKIKKELDKCVLLCANCHREEHGKIHASVSPLTSNQMKG